MKFIFIILLFFSFNVSAKTTKTFEQQVEEATKLGLAYIMTNLYLEGSKHTIEKCSDEYRGYDSKTKTFIGDSINKMIYRNFLTEAIFEQYTDEEYGEEVTKITVNSLNNQIELELELSIDDLEQEIKKLKLEKFCEDSIQYHGFWLRNAEDASLQFLKDIKKFNPNFDIDEKRLEEKLAKNK